MAGLTVTWMDRAQVRPNAYNPNEMTGAQRVAVAESLAEFGFRSPLLARTAEDGAVIIDGEHRWLMSGFVYLVPQDPYDDALAHLFPVASEDDAARLNAERPAVKRAKVKAGDKLPVEWPQFDGDPGVPHGYRRAYVGEETPTPQGALRAFPYLPLMLCDDLTDAQVKKLTVVMDTTRGEMDTVALGALLAELKDSMGVDWLSQGLPWNPVQIDELTTLGGHDWDQYDQRRQERERQQGESGSGSGGGEGSGATGWHTFTVKVKADDMGALNDAREAVREALGELPQHDAEAWGEVFACLSRDYLGAGAPGEPQGEPEPLPV